jgi:hypothetical protein
VSVRGLSGGNVPDDVAKWFFGLEAVSDVCPVCGELAEGFSFVDGMRFCDGPDRRCIERSSVKGDEVALTDARRIAAPDDDYPWCPCCEGEK